MQGYNKDTAAGPVPCLYLNELGETYVRKTSLPPDWKRVIVGMNFAIVGAAGANSAPTSETVIYSTPMEQLSFGLGNGLGCYGQDGNRFVGLVTGADYNCTTNNSSPGWAPFGAHGRPNWAIGNGTTRTQVGDGNGEMRVYNTPTGLTTYCSTYAIDISTTPTGITFNLLSGPKDVAGYSTSSDLDLQQRLNALPKSPTVSIAGGWWLGGDPIGLTHFMVRVPFALNRLRLHAVRVLQMA